MRRRTSIETPAAAAFADGTAPGPTDGRVGQADGAPEPKLVSNVARSVLNLVGRFGAITFLSGLSTIAITRLLGPAGYGQYAAAVATWAVLGATADLGFSLMLSRDLPHLTGSHRATLRAAYEVATAWSSVLAVVMVGLAFSAGITSTRGVALLLLAPSMVFNGLNPARVFFVVRHRTGQLLRLDVITTFLQVVATVLVAALGFGVDAIIAALSAGSIVNGIVVALAAHRLLEPSDVRRIGRRDLIRRSVPLGMLAIMTKVYLTIDLVLLGWLVSGSRLGDYAAASKLLTVLATVAGVVMSGALPAISSLTGRPRDLERLVGRIWTWLAVGVVPIFAAVALFAQPLIVLLLGHSYVHAAPLLRILSLAGGVSVVNSLLGNLMIAFRKTKALFVQNTAAIVTNVTGNLLLVPRFGVTASAWLTAATELLVGLAAMAVIAREVDLGPSLAASVRPAIAVIVSGAVALLLRRWTLPAAAASSASFVLLITALRAWPADFRIRAVVGDLMPGQDAAGSLLDHNRFEAPLSVDVIAPEPLSQRAGVELQRAPLGPHEPAGPGWRWWSPRALIVLVLALLVAAAVYEISNRAPARYQSSATVRVSVQTTSGISDPAVTAANDLASQFAQLASSTPVVDYAAALLGVPAKDLEGNITAGTVAAQNLVRVTATGSGPAQAQARATAVAKAFVVYLDRIDAQQVSRYQKAITSKLGPLTREIEAARKRLGSSNPETQRNATVLLSGLLGQQQTVLSSVAQSSAAAQPSLQLVSPGGTATKASPKPTLYAAIGFLATLLLLGRFLYVVGVRRSVLREAPV